MLERANLVALRDITPSDRNFVFATWLRGLKYGNDFFNAIEAEVYYKVYNKYIEAVLARPQVTVKFACLRDDPEVVLGYAVYEGPVLHWVFVKKAWRSIGIAKSLVPETITTVTHLTLAGKSILHKQRYYGIVFNPFI